MYVTAADRKVGGKVGGDLKVGRNLKVGGNSIGKQELEGRAERR